MWNRPASSGIGLASLYRLKDVQVIQDILDATVVGQPIEESPYGFLALHVHPLHAVWHGQCSAADRLSPPSDFPAR
jgi:hypothetical protein